MLDSKYYSSDISCYSLNSDIEKRFTFGDSCSFKDKGNEHNFQPILLDGKQVGVLHEFVSYNFLEPMQVSFMVSVNNSFSDHPQFFEDEYCWLKFPTFQQFADFILEMREIHQKLNNAMV